MEKGARFPSTRRAAGVIAAFGLAAAGLGACSSSTHTVARSQPGVSFVQSAALAANGTLPTDRSATLNCGSDQYGWLTELTHVPISQAKVAKHLGAFIPTGPVGPDGKPVMAKQMMASGTIASPGAGASDVPLDHPYGGDFSFDERLIPAYDGLDKGYPAPGHGPTKPNLIHDEIQTGMLPHVAGAVQISPGEQWPDLATADESNVVPGFTPQAGDSAAVMGSWVTDCGHRDFHPELHQVNFMAYGHRSGNATVAHAFFNPYESSQLYNPDTALSGKVNDPSTLSSPNTQNVLKYIVTAIERVATGQDPQATLPQVLVPFTSSPAPWKVCAPAGTSGSNLKVSYDFSVRAGVSVTVSPDDASGCATVTTRLTSSYRPADAPGQAECPVTWDWMDSNAIGNGGITQVNIPQEILSQVKAFSPSLAATLAPKVNLPLLVNCYPPLTVSGIPAPDSGAHTVHTSATQVLPFAGWVKVNWGS